MADEPKKSKPTPKWIWFAVGGIALLSIAIVLFIVLVPHPREKTDDAYVAAHYSTISPRVAGQVAEVAVEDNQIVAVGDLLVRLDDRDQRATLAQTDAILAADQSAVIEAAANRDRQPSVIRQAQAQIESARARLLISKADAVRFTNLAPSGAGTVQERERAQAALQQDKATLASAEAQLSAARHQLDALSANTGAAQGRLAMETAQVEQARLTLSYTRILAPIAGVIDQRAIQVGNFVSPGAPVMVVVPLGAIYVTANFREPAMRHMRPGQAAVIHVDAFDIDLNGIVDSLPASSGAAFSAIPPNNASGNFTKIVQRFPVRIRFAPHQPLTQLVRVGMSVETTVETQLENLVGEQAREHAPITQPGPQ